MNKRWVIFCLLFAVGASAQTAPDALFDLHSSFWINLHQTLYREAQRAAAPRGLEPLDPAELTAEQRATWDNAVEFYGTRYKGRRLLLDPELVHINDALVGAPNPNSTLPRLPDEVRGQLVAVAPIYQRFWWPEYKRHNEEWIAWVTPRVAQYGDEIARLMERDFQSKWPHPRVDVSYFVAEIGGAYTTDHPPHTTLSSARITQDWYGFEVLFHEAGHPLALKLERDLDRECAAQKKDCGDLWHATQFYTVGDAVRRVLAKSGVQYDSYAEHNRMYERGNWPRYKPAIERAWHPYLDGNRDWATAIKALVTAL